MLNEVELIELSVPEYLKPDFEETDTIVVLAQMDIETEIENFYSDKSFHLYQECPKYYTVKCLEINCYH